MHRDPVIPQGKAPYDVCGDGRGIRSLVQWVFPYHWCQEEWCSFPMALVRWQAVIHLQVWVGLVGMPSAVRMITRVLGQSVDYRWVLLLLRIYPRTVMMTLLPIPVQWLMVIVLLVRLPHCLVQEYTNEKRW